MLADLNCTFALGDDSENFLSFLHGKWTKPKFHWGWDDISHEEAVRKAEQEFEIYRKREMKMLESDFDKAIKQLPKK